jgi:hypothetical protein
MLPIVVMTEGLSVYESLGWSTSLDSLCLNGVPLRYGMSAHFLRACGTGIRVDSSWVRFASLIAAT